MDIDEIIENFQFLDDYITPQRSNGLRSLVERIKLHAQQALSA